MFGIVNSGIMATWYALLQGAGFLFLSVATALVTVLLVVFLIRHKKSREDIVSMMMLPLAVSDLGSGTAVTAACAVFSWIQPAEIPEPLIVAEGNAFHAFIACSVWQLAFMLACKCYVIVRPMTYSQVLTRRFSITAIVGIWSVGWLTQIVADLAGVRWVPDLVLHLSIPFGVPAKGRRLRQFETYVLFVAPSITIIVSYTRIFMAVRRHHVAISNVVSAFVADAGHHHGWTKSIRSAKSLFIICVGYYVTYLPMLLNNLGFVLPTWYWMTSTYLMFSSGIVNSLLYILLYKSTRRDFRQMFCSKFTSSTVVEVIAVDAVITP